MPCPKSAFPNDNALRPLPNLEVVDPCGRRGVGKYRQAADGINAASSDLIAKAMPTTNHIVLDFSLSRIGPRAWLSLLPDLGGERELDAPRVAVDGAIGGCEAGRSAELPDLPLSSGASDRLLGGVAVSAKPMR